MGQHWVTRNTWASSSHLLPRFLATWLAGSWWIDGVAVGLFAWAWWWLESRALPQFFCHPVSNRSEKSREMEQGNERSLHRLNDDSDEQKNRISSLLFSLSFFFFFFFTDAVVTTLILFLLSKSAISASFLIIYPFAGELYPTQLRGVAIGFSAYISGLGLIIIPFVTYLVSDRKYIYIYILPLVRWILQAFASFRAGQGKLGAAPRNSWRRICNRRIVRPAFARDSASSIAPNRRGRGIVRQRLDLCRLFSLRSNQVRIILSILCRNLSRAKRRDFNGRFRFLDGFR